MRRLLITLLTILALALVISPVAAQDDDEEEGTAPTITDIVIEQAEGDGDAQETQFTLLLTALRVADEALVTSLANPEANYTVFAPTDAALSAALDSMGMTAEEFVSDTELASDILRYHVVPATLDSSLVLELTDTVIGTLLPGTSLTVNVTDDGPAINDAPLIDTDIFALNGVIHVINGVLMPPETGELDEMADEMAEEDMTNAPLSITQAVTDATEADTPEFTVLLDALNAVEFAALLEGEGPYTVFAPTDEAFTALLDELGLTAEELLGNTDLLTDVLRYHVVPGKFGSADLVNAIEGSEDMGFNLATLFDAESLSIAMDDANVLVNDATVTSADLTVGNGVIHVIDTVLVPNPALD